MASKKKSFREKLADSKDYPRVQALTGKMAERFGEGTLLIPARIAAGAAGEDEAEGKKRVTPYWRSRRSASAQSSTSWTRVVSSARTST